jgi:hypothetical protein
VARQIETGSLEGTITNESGPVAKASIDVRNIMTGAVIRVQSDAQGVYKVELPPGRYSLWVRAPGNDSVWIPEVFVELGLIKHKSVRLDRTRRPFTG